MESEGRRFGTLDFLFDYSKGTLWWVKDRLWKEAIPGFHRKRIGHPALSLSRRQLTGLYGPVPMAIGLTKAMRQGFSVKNITNPTSPGVDRLTHFGVLRPRRIRFNELGAADGVSPNDYKPRLDQGETRRLDKMLFGGR